MRIKRTVAVVVAALALGTLGGCDGGGGGSEDADTQSTEKDAVPGDTVDATDTSMDVRDTHPQPDGTSEDSDDGVDATADASDASRAKVDLPYENRTTLEGAKIAMKVPENWNGKLIVYAHGYVQKDGEEPSEPPLVLANLAEDGDGNVVSSPPRAWGRSLATGARRRERHQVSAGKTRPAPLHWQQVAQ